MPDTAGFTVAKCGHAELLVRDLQRSRRWYVDLLGFTITREDRDALFLRGLEEREHHSLVLRKAERPAAGHLAFKVSSDDDLDALAGRIEADGGPVRWRAEGQDPGHGRALRTLDPLGLPIEFYARMDPAERLLQRHDLHRGPGILRIDHFNCQVPDVGVAHAWWTGRLAFRMSEYTETNDGRLWAAWLYRKQTVHDLALMNGEGPRLHHVGFFLEGALNLIRACDILAAAGEAASIERGPGRHGLSNAMFLYLRDPDGHRLELYASDYLTADPALEPIRWSIDDPRRQTFWGHAAPPSWFEQASRVLDLDGNETPTRPGQLQDRPQFAT